MKAKTRPKVSPRRVKLDLELTEVQWYALMNAVEDRIEVMNDLWEDEKELGDSQTYGRSFINKKKSVEALKEILLSKANCQPHLKNGWRKGR